MHNWPIMMPAIAEIFLACAIMALMMLGAYSKKEKALDLVMPATLIVLFITAILVIYVGGEKQLAFNDLFIVDHFAQMMKLMVLLASFLTILISRDFIKREGMAKFEYPILLTFATLGMLMMISANDLMSLYIGLELQSLSLYVMAAFQRGSLRSTEAGLKYFVLGALSSGMLLYGCSLIYGFTGTTSFTVLATNFNGIEHASIGVIIGVIFLLTGLAFKISAVPFHMWTPDVYEGAPTSVTAFFAVAPKVAAMALLLRVMVGAFGDLINDWQQVIIVISMASMALGALAAIAQTNIKRLMAYSSIGHIGFALIGLAAGSEEAIQAVIIYLAIYLVMNIGTFACILCMKRQDRMVEDIKDLAGLKSTNPLLAFALMIFMFSMAGIPPLVGFMGKLFVFKAAIEQGLIALTVVGAIASVISAFYYLRIIKIMYFDEAVDSFDKINSKSIKLVLICTGVITATMILYLPLITNPAAHAAASLFAG